MPWCPKCGAEYVRDCIVCANCQSLLVDKQSPAGDATRAVERSSPPIAGHPLPMGNANKAALETPITAAPTVTRRNTGRNLLIALMLVPILIYLCITVFSALLGVWKSLF